MANNVLILSICALRSSRLSCTASIDVCWSSICSRTCCATESHVLRRISSRVRRTSSRSRPTSAVPPPSTAASRVRSSATRAASRCASAAARRTAASAAARRASRASVSAASWSTCDTTDQTSVELTLHMATWRWIHVALLLLLSAAKLLPLLRADSSDDKTSLTDYQLQTTSNDVSATSGHSMKLLVGTNHISGTADRLRCCQLRWTVTVVNWWPSSVTVYHTDRTMSARHGVARVCQRQRRLVTYAIDYRTIGFPHYCPNPGN